MEGQLPKVGVGVWVLKENKVLLGKRLNAHGEGTYASPGGHLEFGETFEEAAAREAMEEAGIEIENIRVITLQNLLLWEGKHYVDIGLIADWKSGEPTLREPDKCLGWGWYDLDTLPEPLMIGEMLRAEAEKTGTFYFGTIRK